MSVIKNLIASVSMCKPKYLQNALKLVSAAELHVRQKLSLSEVAEYQRDVSAGIMVIFFKAILKYSI